MRPDIEERLALYQIVVKPFKNQYHAYYAIEVESGGVFRDYAVSIGAGKDEREAIENLKACVYEDLETKPVGWMQPPVPTRITKVTWDEFLDAAHLRTHRESGQGNPTTNEEQGEAK